MQIIASKTSRPELAERLRRERAAQHYAAIVDSSTDAILSKDLNGVIMSLNRGAQLLFGYTAEEALKQPVTLLIAVDRYDEEPFILGRMRRGESLDHYETIRQTKDGRLLNISLNVSPIKNECGEIIGASKIARDISESKRDQERLEASTSRRCPSLNKTLVSGTRDQRFAFKRPFRADSHGVVETASARLTALARVHAPTLSQSHADVWKRRSLQPCMG